MSRRRRQCDGKRKYASREVAEQVIHTMRGGRKRRLNTYQCHFCGSWHIGHSPRHRKVKKHGSNKRKPLKSGFETIRKAYERGDISYSVYRSYEWAFPKEAAKYREESS